MILVHGAEKAAAQVQPLAEAQKAQLMEAIPCWPVFPLLSIQDDFFRSLITRVTPGIHRFSVTPASAIIVADICPTTRYISCSCGRIARLVFETRALSKFQGAVSLLALWSRLQAEAWGRPPRQVPGIVCRA